MMSDLRKRAQVDSTFSSRRIEKPMVNIMTSNLVEVGIVVLST